jgi:hypothetical protein
VHDRTPKKIRAKKTVAKTLLEDKTSQGGSGSSSRLRLAVDPGLTGELGDLDEADDGDSWGDDVDLADVKAVERAGARKAHEKAVEEKRAAKRAAREAGAPRAHR